MCTSIHRMLLKWKQKSPSSSQKLLASHPTPMCNKEVYSTRVAWVAAAANQLAFFCLCVDSKVGQEAVNKAAEKHVCSRVSRRVVAPVNCRAVNDHYTYFQVK